MIPGTQPASLIRIHISEADKLGGKPLYEAIVDKCLELGICGASVFKGEQGYGETAEIHRKHLLTRDQPVVIVIVDSEEKIQNALPTLEGMIGAGMIATSKVHMKRVRAETRPD